MGVPRLEADRRRAAPPEERTPRATSSTDARRAGTEPSAPVVWSVAIGLVLARAIALLARAGALLARGLARLVAAAASVARRWWRLTAVPSMRRARRTASSFLRTVAVPCLIAAALVAALEGRHLLTAARRRLRRVDLEAGRRAGLARGRLEDLTVVLLLVHVPHAWRVVRPRAGAACRRMGTAALSASRRTGLAAVAAGAWCRPRLPRLLRGAVVGSLATSTCAVVLLTAAEVSLRAAALTVDVAQLPPLEEPSTVVTSDGGALGTLHGGIRRQVVELSEIPGHVQAAVLAAEDARYHQHRGYDLQAIGRAAVANIRARAPAQGGSTITQQLAKQTYVGSERSLGRKVEELVHAFALEQEHSKDEILERYLNHVYFGAGAYGVGAAAQEFFDLPVEDLTVERAALLASLIRAPGSFDPRAAPDAAARRRDRVLDRMLAVGVLSPEEHRGAVRAPLALAPHRREEVREPYVVAAVRREVLSNPALGETVAQREQLVATGGLTIEVTVDPALQEVTRQVVAARLSSPEGPVAAVASVEVGTGRIRMLHGGEDYTEQQFDLAAQARRQPGSLLKPFMVVAALEQGLSPTTRFDGPATSAYELAGERWPVSNFGGMDHGEVDLREALVYSVNTPFAQLVTEIGHEPLMDVTTRLGVDPERAFGPAESHGPSIVLGGLTHGVSPLEMAGAYAAFADQGRTATPHIVERIIDGAGELLYEAPAHSTPALDPDATRYVAEALEEAVRSGTGRAAALEGHAVLGKTGTTTEGADAWFVGTEGSLSTAVWVGHADRWTPVPGGTGGSVAAPLWRDITAGVLAVRDGDAQR